MNTHYKKTTIDCFDETSEGMESQGSVDSSVSSLTRALDKYGNPQHPIFVTKSGFSASQRDFRATGPQTSLVVQRSLFRNSGFRTSTVPMLSGCSSMSANGSNAISPCTGSCSVRCWIGCPSGCVHMTGYMFTGTENITVSKLAQLDRRNPFKHRKLMMNDCQTTEPPMNAN